MTDTAHLHKSMRPFTLKKISGAEKSSLLLHLRHKLFIFILIHLCLNVHSHQGLKKTKMVCAWSDPPFPLPPLFIDLPIAARQIGQVCACVYDFHMLSWPMSSTYYHPHPKCEDGSWTERANAKMLGSFNFQSSSR